MDIIAQDNSSTINDKQKQRKKVPRGATVGEKEEDSSAVEALQKKLKDIVTGTLLLSSVRLGKELGIFDAMVRIGPVTSLDLAENIGLSKRYVHEWCIQLTANGVIEYNAESDQFFVSLAIEDVLTSEFGIVPMICCLSENHTPQYKLLKNAFSEDTGIYWGDMVAAAKCANAFFKPVYDNMLEIWIGSEPILKDTLSKVGAHIADIGCGFGASTCRLASLFPNANVLGVDFHQESVEKTMELVHKSNLNNACAISANAGTWALKNDYESCFDVICFFDCYHDMPDPESVAHQAFHALKPGGIIFLIEPLSSYGDTTREKLELSSTIPLYSGFNVCFCTPCGKCCTSGKEGLGTTAGTSRYEHIFSQTGFASFKTFGRNCEISPSDSGFRLMLAIK